MEGAVISSVVPPLTDVLKKALQKLTHAEILVVGPGVKTGLHLKMDNPAAVGSDLVVDAVAASALYGTPAIVIDMGTATTLSVLDREGAYVGTIILPGARISLDSLVSGTITIFCGVTIRGFRQNDPLSVVLLYLFQFCTGDTIYL